MIGSQLGHYRFLEKIGTGGMGEVYRARDTRLERDVALKILPQAFVADAERVARFQREAKVLASLNHPHIAAIYGLEEEAPVTALVMELVEGEDLAQRLRRGPIPLDEALPIAKQIAEALEAAHGQGIIHRDLKPANIKVRSDGTVKVLDFGLAKAIVNDVERPDLADSPTVTAVATRAGTLLGTASYMSPEQAKGRPVDKRTDVWAFGAVLYELLTGKRAFQGESVAEILSHVLTQPPNWALLPADTPAPILTLLRRSLEKTPTRRLDSAAALRLEIDDALAAPAGVTTAGAPPLARRRRVTWETIVGVVAASLLTAVGTWAVARNESPEPALATRFLITFPPSEPMELTGVGRDIAVSPDGRHVVYLSGGGRLMLRALDQLDGVPLSNVRGRAPFFSHDGRWIGFFDGPDLKKVAVSGEPVVSVSAELGSTLGGSGTWGDDDTIVVSSVSAADRRIGLRSVSSDGGEAKVLTTTDGKDRHGFPSMLPGGRGVLFTRFTDLTQDPQIVVLDLESGQQKTVVNRGLAGQYLDTGHLIYAMAGSQGSSGAVFATLWVVAFDLEGLAVHGDPVRVGETLQVDMWSTVNFAVSRNGVLAYVPARERLRSFVWVDRTGRETAIDALAPRPYDTMGLSSDGKRVAFAVDDREAEIFAFDFARNTSTRLTFDRRFDFLPRWTPNDERIVFTSNRAGAMNLYSVSSGGADSDQAQRLTTASNDQYPNSVTRDGTILFAELRAKTGYDILRLPFAASAGAGTATLPAGRPPDATPLLETSSTEYAANISPNGRYFAYISAASDGRFAVYVRAYPDGDEPSQISTRGGTAPVWAHSGRELFYVDESSTLMAVSVDTTGPQFKHDQPERVFAAGTKYWGDFYSYDVTPEGRFLMLKNVGQREARIVVVLNWFEELKRLEGFGRAR